MIADISPKDNLSKYSGILGKKSGFFKTLAILVTNSDCLTGLGATALKTPPISCFIICENIETKSSI